MRTVMTLGVVAWVVAVLVVLVWAPGGLTSASHPDGPVAYWPFDDGSDPTDDAAHTNDGTLGTGVGVDTSDPAYEVSDNAGSDIAPVPGNVDALVFDGSDDFVKVDGLVADVASNNTGTISLWVKFNSGVSGDTANIFTVSKGDTTNYLQINVDAGTDRLRFVLFDASTFLTTKVTTATFEDAYHHVAVTSDGSTTKFYVDGVEPTLSTNADSGNWFNDLSGLTAARIGGILFGGSERSFGGKIDEVQVYNRALSAAEIAQLATTSTTLVVDDDGLSGFGTTDCDGVGVPTYDSIQDAIDAAAADDTIFVCNSDDDVGADADGQDEYAEDLTITTDGLELVGEDMSDTIIEGVAMGDTGVAPFPTAVPNIDIRANDVSIHNFTIKSPELTTGTLYTSGIVPTGTDIEIYDNYIVVSSGTPGSQGIQTWNTAALAVVPDDISGLSIHDNAFSSQDPNTVGFGYEGIFINPQGGTIDPANPVEITDNTFSGDMYRAVGSVRSYVTIGGTGNTMETDLPVTPGTTDFGDVPLGIKVFDGDHVRVLDNMITDDGSGNFNVAITTQGGTVTDSDVTRNTVETSALHGIHVKSGADGWDVGFNDVSGVTDDAIQIDSDGNVVGNNHVHNNGDDGIDINGDNNIVHHNDVHDSAEDGIQVDGDSNDVDKNNVHHNGDNGIEVNGDNNNGGITDNNVHQNTGNGIDVSGDNNDVVGNNIHHNDGDGLDETGSSNTCSDNKIKKNVGSNAETCN